MQYDGVGEGKPSVDNTDSIARWNADTFNANQYTKIQVACTLGGTATRYAYLIARCNGTYISNPHLYWAWTDGGSDTALFYGNGDLSLVTLGTSNGTTFADGDEFKLDCVGTNITLSKNGVPIISAVDSTITGADPPGCGCWGDTAGVRIDNWEGGSPFRFLALLGVG